MIRPLLFALMIFSLFPNPPVSAQSTPKTPGPGSPERSAILDVLRKPVEEVLKQPVLFKIDQFKVLNGWAFLRGVPLDLKSKPINYKGTVYEEAIKEEAFDDSFCALLQKQSDGTWKIVAWQIGATDAIWVTWDQDYKAPAFIFQP